MIVQLRGTSGSGKSTLVKQLMALYGPRYNVKMEGRKQPLAYILTHPQGGRSLAVLGHYETACGGCDTLPSYDRIVEMVRQSHAGGYDVLFEGLLISGEVERCARLHEDGLPYRVYALSTDIDTCVTSINVRRREKNPDKEDVRPDNTVAKYKTVQGAMAKLAARGVTTGWVSRENGLQTLREVYKV